MKFFSLILLISLTCEAQQDKWQHIVAGTVISTVSYHLLVRQNGNKWKSRAGAVLITFVAAVGKEYYDLVTRKGVYDKRDIWRTMAGCASITFTFKLKKK